MAITKQPRELTTGLVASKRRRVPSIALALIQDKEVNAGWMRANFRATFLRIRTSGFTAARNEALKNVLSSNQPTMHAWAALKFTLHYADTGEQVTPMKRNKYEDRFDLMTPKGAMAEAHHCFSSSFGVHSKQGVVAHERDSSNCDAPWDCEMLQVENCDGELQLSMRVSTNITSHTHNDRRFYWRAELSFQDEGIDVGEQFAAVSHVFDYRPRPPPGLSECPMLNELVCDARGGDLLLCMGQRIGDEYDDVFCELVDHNGRDITLSRVKASKHSYVARLPKDITEGVWKVQMRVEDGAVSNALDLQVLLPGSPPATPEHDGSVPLTPAHDPSAVQVATAPATTAHDEFEAIWQLDDDVTMAQPQHEGLMDADTLGLWQQGSQFFAECAGNGATQEEHGDFDFSDFLKDDDETSLFCGFELAGPNMVCMAS